MKSLKKALSLVALVSTFSFIQAQPTSLLKEKPNINKKEFTIPKRLSNYFKKYPFEFIEISKAAKNQKEKTFYYLPKQFLELHANELVTLAKIAGKDSWSIFSEINYLTDKNGKEKMSFQEAYNFILKLNKSFNITNFNRYETSDLMKDNLKNSDICYNQEKPIALVIQNKNDEENVFAHTNWINNLSKLKEQYKLFIYEAEKDSVAFSCIKKTAEKYGKISLLVLAGHGNEISLNLGKPEKEIYPLTKKEIIPYERFYLDITDKKEFKEQEKYIKKDAKIILASCSTGNGREYKNNLANMIAKTLPGRTIYSPEDEAKTPLFEFNEECNKKSLKKIIFYGEFLKTGYKEITYITKYNK